MEVLKLIEERQSARGPFDPERPIAQDDLKQILEAGRWSPTAHNDMAGICGVFLIIF